MVENNAMKKFFIYCSILCLLSGCLPILIGVGIAGVTGYAIVGDSAKGNVEGEYRELWDASLKTLKEMKAGVYLADESKGRIKARVNGYNVALKINIINPGIQRLKVSAQKLLLPKPQFAQEIFQNIVQALQ